MQLKSREKYKGFEPLGSILYKTAKQKKLLSATDKYRVAKGWQEVAGSFFQGAETLTKPVDFKNGILRIACLSLELAEKIRLFSQRIIYSLNNLLGGLVVKMIIVEV